ncbi:MAG: Na+/H+ antiporter subunit E [Planctomycetota bacterium]
MSLSLLLNVAFTLLWLLLTQNTSFLNGVLGFVLGALVVTLSARAAGKQPYVGQLINLGRFASYFLYILIKANLEVAWEIVTPQLGMKPRMIRYEVAGLSEVQLTTLASAITLTPGTLSADVDEAGEYLYIHAMYAEKRDDAVADLDELRERLLRLVFGCDRTGKPLEPKC